MSSAYNDLSVSELAAKAQELEGKRRDIEDRLREDAFHGRSSGYGNRGRHDADRPYKRVARGEDSDNRPSAIDVKVPPPEKASRGGDGEDDGMEKEDEGPRSKATPREIKTESEKKRTRRMVSGLLGHLQKIKKETESDRLAKLEAKRKEILAKAEQRVEEESAVAIAENQKAKAERREEDFAQKRDLMRQLEDMHYTLAVKQIESSFGAKKGKLYTTSEPSIAYMPVELSKEMKDKIAQNDSVIDQEMEKALANLADGRKTTLAKRQEADQAREARMQRATDGGEDGMASDQEGDDVENNMERGSSSPKREDEDNEGKTSE